MSNAIQTSSNSRGIVSWSHRSDSIHDLKKLKGESRAGGDASSFVKNEVKKELLKESSDLSLEDQAILLSIAHFESGFNPDAASPKSSASGVFQFIDSTGRAFGLDSESRFEATANIKAGIGLYKENLRLLPKGTTGVEKMIHMYALHHDGPSLKYGGAQLARKYMVRSFYEYSRSLSRNSFSQSQDADMPIIQAKK